MPTARMHSGTRTSTVVVADGNVLATDCLCLLLESYGFAVVLLYDGCEAQILVEALTPAVLISDIEMPGKSGIELAQAVQAQDGAIRPAKIAVSGRTSLIDQALAVGFDYFLVRPANPERLVSLVLELLDPAKRR